MIRVKKKKGFSLAEVIVTVMIVGVLMSTVFIGGSKAVNDARKTGVVRDLQHFDAAVTTALFDHPEAAAIKNNNPTGILARLIETINGYLDSNEQIQNPTIALTTEDGRGSISIFPTTANSGAYAIFASGKEDPWGNPYYFIFDSSNRKPNNAEFHISVVSAGPNTSAEIGGRIDSDDIFLLNELVNGRVYSAIYDCSTIDGFDNYENDYVSRLAGFPDAIEGNTALYTDSSGKNTPSANPEKTISTTTSTIASGLKDPELSITRSRDMIDVGESVVFNASRQGTGIIGVISANSSVAHAHVDGTIVTVTGVKSGSTTVTVQCASTKEYKYSVAVYNVTVVGKEDATKEFVTDRIETSPIAYAYISGTALYFDRAAKSDDVPAGAYTNFETRASNPWLSAAKKAGITTVEFKDYIRPISTASWFNGLTTLEKITHINRLDTSNVTNMNQMFCSCTKLTALDVNMLNTSSVVNMSSMFQGCSSLTTLDLDNLDTSNVTNMQSMFNGCTKLESIDIAKLNTSNVTNMSQMFRNCSSLTSLDVSKWDTSNVTNMGGNQEWGYRFYGMFYNCSKLTNIDVSNWNTSSAENLSGMFYKCSGLTNLDISNWDTSNVRNMAHMFMDCNRLESLDVSKFSTSKVTDMRFLFANCSKLSEIDVSQWDTSNTTCTAGMFYNCSKVTSLDIAHFDMSKVTWTYGMFQGCSQLTSLDVSQWDVGNLDCVGGYASPAGAPWEGTFGMFLGCNKLETLDVSNWDVSKVRNFGSMFANCSKLKSLDVSNWDVSNGHTMASMFSGCSSLKNLDLSKWKATSLTNGAPFPMTYWHGTAQMFMNCSSLTSIDIGGFETSKVTNMQQMFWNCSQLPSLDVSSLDTTNVSNMYGMFGYCSKLTALDVSMFNTEKVTNMSSLFQNCQAVKILDLSKFITTKVTNMSNMFYNCAMLESVDVSGFDTSKVTSMQQMFWNCAKLETLDVSGFNTNNVTNMNGLFANCSKLIAIDVSEFNTAKVTNMSNMFSNCSTLVKILATSTFDASSVPNSTNMFYNCTKLVGENGTVYNSSITDKRYARIDEVGKKGYFTSKARDVMLSNPIEFAYIDGETLHFDRAATTEDIPDGAFTDFESNSSAPWLEDARTKGITTVNFKKIIRPMSTASWFDGITTLEEILNIHRLNTTNVTNMASMFKGCSSLTTLDLNNLDTINTTDMSSMFANCSSLETLDVSGLDTSEVTNMQLMFNGCSKLKSLDVLGLNVHNVVDMSKMFGNCSGLTFLDISGWDTKSLKNTDELFSGCTNLRKVWIGDGWEVSGVTNSTDMFNSCENLPNFDQDKLDKTNAHCRDGGYLTYRGVPDGFQRVKYIEGTGTQWIDTEIKYQAATYIVDIVCTITQNKNNYWLFGTSDFEAGLYNGFYTPNFTYKQNGDILTITGKKDNPSISYSPRLFARNFKNISNETNPLPCKIYSFTVYENGSPIRDFLPAYRIEDGEIGMYDLITENYYTNSGSGVFLKGPDV